MTRVCPHCDETGVKVASWLIVELNVARVQGLTAVRHQTWVIVTFCSLPVRPFLYLDKYIFQFKQIHFLIWRNICLKFGQIHFSTVWRQCWVIVSSYQAAPVKPLLSSLAPIKLSLTGTPRLVYKSTPVLYITTAVVLLWGLAPPSCYYCTWTLKMTGLVLYLCIMCLCIMCLCMYNVSLYHVSLYHVYTSEKYHNRWKQQSMFLPLQIRIQNTKMQLQIHKYKYTSSER